MSNYFDQVWQKLFPSKETVPLQMKENFTLKDKEVQELEDWIHSEAAKSLFSLIYRNYHYKRTQINESPEVHLFTSSYANGFAISYEAPLDLSSFSLLFLGLSRRVLALGYQQVSLDRKLEEINEQVKQTEKFYFKPPLQMPQEREPITQLYGNISLEKVSINNTPSYIKLLAAIYSDRNYQEAKPFDELMDKLFEHPSHE
ncbi:MAG: hypothetical protein ACK5BR_03465 [Bacteroidota bacterium]|jgi:hypothetical protein|nr:hypothetical protein [Algoriphagus sp.]